MGDDAAHNFEKVFAGFLGDESVFGVGPAELETGGKGGDPDFANGRVGRNYELGLLRFLEDNFEFSGFAFDVETMLIARSEHAALEFLERGVGFSLKVFFIEHAFSVHEESESWVVGSGDVTKQRSKEVMG